MKIVATIEARLNSTRLPNKHLYKIRNKTIIEILIQRLKKIKNISKIIISTTTNKIDKQLVQIAKKNGIGFFQGSEENVLQRVVKSAKKYKADAILQVSGDCPLIDYSLADHHIEMFKVNKVDIATQYWKSFPRGISAPIIKLTALEKSLKNYKNNDDLEHVTNYIFENQGKFKILYLLAPESYYCPELELLLDEYEDFKFLKKITKYDKYNKLKTYDFIKIFKQKKVIRKNKIKRKNKKINKFIKLSQ